MKLYRSMKEDADGMPSLGRTGRSLGVRLGNAVIPDVLALNETDMIGPNQGGMSVAPGDPMRLKRHRRPPSLGGIGQDPVWCIDVSDLSGDLLFRQDDPTHGLVEPAHTMTLKQFEDALASTRPFWKWYCR